MRTNFKFNSQLLAIVVTLAIALQGFQPVQASPSNFTPNHNPATTWYVSTTGNDSNSCSDPTSPCSTIQAALDKAIDGDIIYVARGTYTSNSTNGVEYIVKKIKIAGGWNEE
jgi:hypothetical protein